MKLYASARFLTAVVSFLLVNPSLLGQDILGDRVGELPPPTPAIFALKGGTVHVGDGRVLPQATVLIRDGLIQGVSTRVQIPPEAWEIDVSGMHLYPGLIDALTERGLTMPEGTGSPSQGRHRPENHGEESGLRAHIHAADLIDPTSQEFATWRESGILSLHLAPSEGIFRGQTVLVNLNDGSADEMIVASPVAFQLSLKPLDSARFPGSLLGVIAHIRQTILNARHYEKARDIYGRNPRGLSRPETDRELEALGSLVDGSQKAILPAKRQREIKRLLELSEELNLKAIIAGGFEAGQVVDELRAQQVPVLLSLNFPKAEEDRHPEAEDSLDELLYRQNALRAAIALHEAGLPLAFFSDGISKPAEFLNNLRLLKEEGLKKEALLEGLTLSAARILEVDRQLGSLEEGKIANLVITEGELFEEDVQLKFVFVDGKKFEIPPREKEDLSESSPVEGQWQVTVTAPETIYKGSLHLERQEQQLTGTLRSSQFGTLTLFDGRVSGQEFTFKVQVDLGEGPVQVVFSGQVTGDSLSGTAVTREDSASLEGTRIPERN